MISLENVKKVALVGASGNKSKFGYKILKDLMHKNFEMYPVSPNYEELEGLKVFKDVSELPKDTDLIVFVVPAKIGIEVAKKAYENGHRNLWFQPGAESKELETYIKSLKEVNYSFINCIMVET